MIKNSQTIKTLVMEIMQRMELIDALAGNNNDIKDNIEEAKMYMDEIFHAVES